MSKSFTHFLFKLNIPKTVLFPLDGVVMVGTTLDWSSLWNKRCGVLVTGAEGDRGSGGGADGLMIGGVVSLLFLGETERRDLSLTAEGSLLMAPPDGVEVVDADTRKW